MLCVSRRFCKFTDCNLTNFGCSWVSRRGTDFLLKKVGDRGAARLAAALERNEAVAELWREGGSGASPSERVFESRDVDRETAP